MITTPPKRLDGLSWTTHVVIPEDCNGKFYFENIYNSNANERQNKVPQGCSTIHAICLLTVRRIWVFFLAQNPPYPKGNHPTKFHLVGVRRFGGVREQTKTLAGILLLLYSDRWFLQLCILYLESEEGDVEDNRIPSIASSRSNMSEHSVDASQSPLNNFLASPGAASGGGNPRISAPLQNSSLGSGTYQRFFFNF